MGESYCGKSCDSCPVREPENCPGCKNGPGSPWSGECELARCCRDKGHDSCNTCNLSYQCSMYNNREWQPDYRARRRSDNAAMIERSAAKAGYLAKWLTPLFWLYILNTAANLMTDENVLSVLPGLYWPGTILTLACYAGIIVVLYKLKAEDEFYGKSANMHLINLLLTLLALAFQNVLGILILIASAALSLASTYYEFTAHSRVLAGVSNTMSESWRKLWRWFLYSYIGVIVAVLLLFISATLAALLTFAAALAMFVVSIMKLVYLWRTIKCFKSMTK